MHPEQQDFEQLRRLLALKRHEIPPPGYFNRFSDQILHKLEASGQPPAPHSSLSGWLQRFWSALDARPALAGAAGVALCGVFAAGVVFSDQPESSLAQFGELQGMNFGQQTAGLTESPLLAKPLPTEFSSTAGMPMVPVKSAFFQGAPPVQLDRTIYQIGN